MNERLNPGQMRTPTEIREESEDVGRNASGNPTMGDIINRRYSRRGFLGGSLAVAAIGATVSPMALLAAGEASNNKLWRFPLSPAYDKLIDSPIADMKNVGPREAGSITAAQFLKRFIKDGTPWAHLDIAGMAWSNKPGATYGKGATGYGVRLLDQYVRDVLEG